MAHLFMQHMRRQRKYRLATKVPLVFREPTPPTKSYLVRHLHLDGTQDPRHGAIPPLSHAAMRVTPPLAIQE